jgi:hypothetical protein
MTANNLTWKGVGLCIATCVWVCAALRTDAWVFYVVAAFSFIAGARYFVLAKASRIETNGELV